MCTTASISSLALKSSRVVSHLHHNTVFRFPSVSAVCPHTTTTTATWCGFLFVSGICLHEYLHTRSEFVRSATGFVFAEMSLTIMMLQNRSRNHRPCPPRQGMKPCSCSGKTPSSRTIFAGVLASSFKSLAVCVTDFRSGTTVGCVLTRCSLSGRAPPEKASS